MFGNEIEIIRAIEGARTGFLNGLFEFITLFGEDIIMVLLIAVLYFAFDKKLAQKLFFVSMTGMCVNGTIKNIAKVPRPFARGISCVRESTATGYSFPSGHTQVFASWSSILAKHFNKLWLTIACIVMIVLVAFSRMYLGAHYLSDVIVGAVLGAGIGILGSMIYERAENKLMLFIVTAAVFLPFVVWFAIESNEHYEDFFKFYGMLVAFIPAYVLESKFPITYDVPIWKKCVRVLIVLLIALGVKEGLKVLYIDGNVTANLFIDMARYALMMFICMGVCPVVYKKIKL
jgi:membrane-associated phospholipid phosphatase